MDVKTILGLTSAVFGAGIVTQDPSFQYPGVRPILTNEPEIIATGTGTVSSSNAVFQKQISVRFKDASVSEVLDWLSNQGVSFVTTGLSKDAKINLNLNNVPLDAAVRAIGSALGGSWTQNDTVYVFRSEPSFYADKQGVVREMPAMPAMPGMPAMPPMNFEFKSQNMEQLAKDLEKKFGADSEFAKRMEKQFGENSEFAKEMQKKFGPDSEFAKKMKAQALEQKAFGEKFRAKAFDNKAFAEKMKAHEKMMEDLEMRMKTDKDLKDFHGFDDSFKFSMPEERSFVFSHQGQDLKSVAKSLTPAQREKNKKQGFLYWSDLTPDQQKKLGVVGGNGTWTIQYSNNGETFTVKSDRKK
ncbi:MAG: hypothetical protein BGO01_03125 [Armatimonadetes bacterium 55-13]|nr:MAG: hypothetical protein BGO01_03125 [Armatimonadetes bacterium 55-13]